MSKVYSKSRGLSLAASPLVFGLLMAGPAGAQPAGADGFADCRTGAAGAALAVGTCIRSTLDDADQETGGVRYEEFSLRAGAGETLLITMDAIPTREVTDEDPSGGTFDTLVEIYSAAGGDPVAVNDDRPGSLNSTIIFTPPRAGAYRVRARSFAGGTGPYALRATRLPPQADPLPLADTVRGRVDPALTRPELRGTSMDGVRYQFQGRAGERVQLRLQSEQNGVEFAVAAPDGAIIAGGASYSTREDGSGPGQSETVMILPSDGTYVTQVAASAEAGAQNFELSLQRGTARPVTVETLAVGGDVSGSFGLTSPSRSPSEDVSSSLFYQDYRLAVTADRPVTVTVEGVDGFSPLLLALSDSLLGPAVPLSSYESGMGTAVVLRPQASGAVTIRVMSGGLATGSYRLRVVDGDQGLPAPVADEHGH